MDWQNLPGSNNVEDRRGSGGGGRLPGGGVAVGGGAALILALIGWFFGIDTSSITGGGSTTQTAPTQTQRQSQAQPQSQGGQARDQNYQFVSKILGSTEQVWGDIFQKNNRTYRDPSLVLYSGTTDSACGQADSAVGPFYCPSDQKVYLDTFRTCSASPIRSTVPSAAPAARRRPTSTRWGWSFRPTASPASGARGPAGRTT